jgi:hypothetical protein
VKYKAELATQNYYKQVKQINSFLDEWNPSFKSEVGKI